MPFNFSAVFAAEDGARTKIYLVTTIRLLAAVTAKTGLDIRLKKHGVR